MTFVVCASVPIERATRLLKKGWIPGRSNGFNQTIARAFYDEKEATAAARKLPTELWTVERD